MTCIPVAIFRYCIARRCIPSGRTRHIVRRQSTVQTQSGCLRCAGIDKGIDPVHGLRRPLLVLLLIFASVQCVPVLPTPISSARAPFQLEELYRVAVSTPSEINEHLPALRCLGLRARSVIEIGSGAGRSSTAFLLGLAEGYDDTEGFNGPLSAKASTMGECAFLEGAFSPAQSLLSSDLMSRVRLPDDNTARVHLRQRRLLMVDLGSPSRVVPHLVHLGSKRGVDTIYRRGNVLMMHDPPVSDVLFIDSFHCHGQLKRELGKLESRTRRWIVLHDTEVDGPRGECHRARGGSGNCFDVARSLGWTLSDVMTGLGPSLAAFLASTPGRAWRVKAHFRNNNGLTVLERIASVGVGDAALDATAVQRDDQDFSFLK